LAIVHDIEGVFDRGVFYQSVPSPRICLPNSELEFIFPSHQLIGLLV
jgi:hypothetical protein